MPSTLGNRTEDLQDVGDRFDGVRDLEFRARYLGLATRICGELGAQVVKTYNCAGGFEKVTADCQAEAPAALLDAVAGVR